MRLKAALIRIVIFYAGMIPFCFGIPIPVQLGSVFAKEDFPKTSPKNASISLERKNSKPSIPEGQESYLDRPDILKMRSRPLSPSSSEPVEYRDFVDYSAGGVFHDFYHEHFEEAWKMVRAGLFSFVAELLALYPPETQFYFLARDGELLYDIARLVTQGGSDFQRMHLINVTRASKTEPNLKDYLQENGISEEALSAGKKILFIDSGFTGTIVRAIREIFPENLQQNLKAHLIMSGTHRNRERAVQHPSSRAFLVHINPSVNEQGPDSMHYTTLVFEEDLPKYTNQATHYYFLEGRYHPLSKKRTEKDIDLKKRALALMRDIRAHWERKETKEHFFAEKGRLEQIKSILSHPTEETLGKVRSALEGSKNTHDGRLLKAQVLDVFESQENEWIQLGVNPSSLGLELVQTSIEVDKWQAEKKEQEEKKKGNDEKKQMNTENDETMDQKFLRLFQDGRWEELEKLPGFDIHLYPNYSLLDKVIPILFNEKAYGSKRNLQIKFIESKFDVVLGKIIILAFRGNKKIEEMEDLLEMIIEKAERQGPLHYIAGYIFSMPNTQNMNRSLSALIKNGDDTVIKDLRESLSDFKGLETRERQILVKSLEINDSEQRNAWINLEQSRIKPTPSQQNLKTMKGKSALKCSQIL